MGRRSGHVAAHTHHPVVVVDLCLEDGHSHGHDRRIYHSQRKRREVVSGDDSLRRSREDRGDRIRHHRSSRRRRLEDSGREQDVGSENGSGREGAQSAHQQYSERFDL